MNIVCWTLRDSLHLCSSNGKARQQRGKPCIEINEADDSDSTMSHSLMLLKERDAALQARHAFLEVLEVAAGSRLDSGLDLQGHCIRVADDMCVGVQVSA